MPKEKEKEKRLKEVERWSEKEREKKLRMIIWNSRERTDEEKGWIILGVYRRI